MGEAHATETAERLLRTQEVAAWLAVSKSTLVRWRQSFEGPEVGRRRGQRGLRGPGSGARADWDPVGRGASDAGPGLHRAPGARSPGGAQPA